jgi:hypothetical protein
MAATDRLSFSFHQTFIPERTYLTAMLCFAAAEKEATLQEISQITGIPMGKSSGKTPAILEYCCAMGLLAPQNKRGARKSPRLTAFGRIVYLEDKFIKQPLTQWLAHFNMCRPFGGAEAWYLTFAKGRKILGDSFEQSQLEHFLHDSSGGELQTSLVGPLIRTYLDSAALLDTQLLRMNGETVRRAAAPIAKDFIRGYAAWIITLLETHFSDQREVAVTDLQELTLWEDITGWTTDQCDHALTLIQELGFIDVNRHIRPWIVTRLHAAADVWPTIYRDLV